MSSLLYRLALTMIRRRGLVVALWLAALVFGGATAALVQRGTDDAFTIPGSSSQAALDALQRTFPQASGSSAQLVVTVPGGRVDAPAVRSAVEAAITSLGRVDQVAEIVSPYSDVVKGQIADSGRALIVTVPLEVDTLSVTEATRDEIRTQADTLRATLPAGSRVDVGGQAFANTIPKPSLLEALGVVVALIALLALFRSVIAALLPMVTALIGVGIAIALIYGATSVMTISSTAPMLALMLGLAVGIDYTLLILSRHRDQLTSGMPVGESIARAVATAGSAVVFAGLTVIIALLGLGVVGIPFLTVMGVGAAVAVVVALAVAVSLLPALLAIAGERLRPRDRTARRASAGQPQPGTGVDAPAVATGSAAAGPAEVQRHHLFQDMAHWWVTMVTRRPIPVLIAVLGLVALMAWPAPSLRLGLPDNGATPVGTATRTTYDAISAQFGPGFNGPLLVTADIVSSTDPLGVMAGLRRDIEALPNVKLVSLATPNRTADTGIVQVIPNTGPQSDQTAALVERLRAEADTFRARYGVDTAVTGFTAVGIDVSARLGASLLPFGLVVVGLCLVLLTVVFRSVTVPIKATAGYVLSVLAAFGVTALVFSHGWLADLFRVAQVGSVISFLPILLMGVLFGLAMDYEVFIVSRMSEEYVHSGRARHSVVAGFTASAPVVSVAAFIMLAVFAAFIPADNANLKPIAFGLTVGVAIDAFLIRMTAVPAVMALLGRRAWWMPGWLARRVPRLDVEGEGVVHELSLADWPTPGSTDVVSAEEVRVHRPDGTLLGRLDRLHLGSGRVAVLHGSPIATRAVATALSGRVTDMQGRLKVAGLVLPTRAREVRRRVAYLAAEPERQLVTKLEAAVRDRLPLVIVERIDTLAPGPTPVVDALRRLLEAGTALVGTAAEGAAATAALAPLGAAGVSQHQVDPTREHHSTPRQPAEVTR
ncbi:MAG TPA: MMPL family transporter [Dermatophilaceae bacterium]|nr:MMPL family transporter [Dermatophilaceae bacterium]